ncbi:MAG TPA: glycosyltransferase family 2 protein [Candidatus Saccharimonadia bacterium]|nr:glycosyltransferase family 2 protein [Candidatus Saccharimonadia bacterium]
MAEVLTATPNLGLRLRAKINLDQLAGTITLPLLALYVAAFGARDIHGFVLNSFNTGYLAIIIPIWVIDGVRGLLDIIFAGNYKLAKENIKKVTVIIACKDGEQIIGRTLDDLKEKFKPKQIIVVVNGSTDKTASVVRSHKVQCIEVIEPIGKVRAINVAVPTVKTPYVLLLDDDTLLKGATVPTELLDLGYTGVAFRVHVRKSKAWVTQLQAHEYRKGSDVGKKRQNKRAAVQNISGAIGLYTKQELERQIGLHNGEFAGEDLQRTMLLHQERSNQGVVLSDSIVFTEPPASLTQLYKQRVFGWFPGLYANLTNFLKLMFGRNTPINLREDAFYNIVFVMCMDIIRILALPIMIFYPWYFVVMYITYVLLESIAYLKVQCKEPYWVVLIYPFFGLFGLITRFGAFSVFCYRRIIAKLCRLQFRDDFRHAPFEVKALSFLIVVTSLTTILLLNVAYDYSHFFTDPQAAIRLF